jgi:hypothetical protein
MMNIRLNFCITLQILSLKSNLGSVIFSGGRGGLGIQALPLSHGFQPRIISIRANIPDKFV